MGRQPHLTHCLAVAALLLHSHIAAAGAVRAAVHSPPPPPPAQAIQVAAIEHVAYTGPADIASDVEAASVMNRNLDALEAEVARLTQAGVAAGEPLDLVLFPEMALTSLTFQRARMALFLMNIPDEYIGHNVCADTSLTAPAPAVFRRLACVARDHKVNLVANWGNRFPCSAGAGSKPPCPADGHYQYNTELAFDYNGALRARYHKLHTFNATEFDSPSIDQPGVTFDVHSPRTGAFLQTVALLVCFDTMFPTPAVSLLNSPFPTVPSVTTFTVSHWWVDQNAYMNAVTYFQALSRAWGVNIIAAATVWPAIYPWGSGSGVFSRGHVLGSVYRTQQRGVAVGNDLAVTATVPALSHAQSNGALLPHVVSPWTSYQKPLPMCENWLRFEAADFYDPHTGSPTWVNRSLACLNFTCSVAALAGPRGGQPDQGLQDGMYWFLYMDWGYYQMADGNNVYYFEQFCTLFQCPHAEGCASHQDQILDDHGSSQWQRLEVSASLDNGAIVFPMTSGGDGNVYEHVLDHLTVSRTYPSATDPLSTNFPVVHDGRGTTATLDPSRGMGRGEGQGQGAQVATANVINLSLLGRLYSADIVVVQAAG